jgi:hypothetical protein
MPEKLKNLNLALLTVGLVLLAFFIIYTGVQNFISEDYTSLGDPYYSNQTLVFERAPAIILITLINILFIAFHFLLKLLKK